MIISRALLTVLLIINVTACSHKATYDNIRLHNIQRCIKQPPPIYDECIDRNSKTYEEYEQERKILVDE